jgi:hypothetical protein
LGAEAGLVVGHHVDHSALLIVVSMLFAQEEEESLDYSAIMLTWSKQLVQSGFGSQWLGGQEGEEAAVVCELVRDFGLGHL